MPIKLSDFYTKIDVEPYGTIELLSLMLDDMTWLVDPQTKALPARTFTANLIHNHIVSPILDIETVNGWPDSLLAFVATHWLKDLQQQHEDALPTVLSFEEFKQAVYAYNDEQLKEIRESFDSFATIHQQLTTTWFKAIPSINPFTSGLNNTIGPVIPWSNLASGLSNIGSQFAASTNIKDHIGHILAGYVTGLDSLYQNLFATTQLISVTLNSLVQQVSRFDFTLPALQTQQIFSGLLDFTEYEEFWKEAQEANQSFEQAGYGFMNHFISFRTIHRFASVHPQVRNAAITNRMAAYTRHKKFEEQLHQLFQESSALRRRWKIIAQILVAHRQRAYYISVPALLAQVEGIIGDALILKQHLLPCGHKLYLKGTDGKPQLDDKGKPKTVKGLDQLIRHSSWKDHPMLHGASDLITTQLTGERNGVMHGRRMDYGTAKLSAQTLLLILVLASEFAAIENGKL